LAICALFVELRSEIKLRSHYSKPFSQTGAQKSGQPKFQLTRSKIIAVLYTLVKSVLQGISAGQGHRVEGQALADCAAVHKTAEPDPQCPEAK